jgi:hypothetical protein
MNQHLGQRGQTLPLIAICFTVIMSFAAMAIDMNYANYRQMQMQTATDDAAIAAAQTLMTGGCPNQTAATTAAQNNATTNGFPSSLQTTVTVDNPPTAADGPWQGNNCAVSVKIAVPNPQSWFFNATGYLNATGYKSMSITTQAVALMQTNNPACIFLLKSGVINTFTSAHINAPGCALEMNGNGTGTWSAATIAVEALGYSNGSSPSGGTFPDATPTPMLAVADPCPEIAGCAAIAANPPSATGCTSLTQSGGTVSPGCYSTFSPTGAITLSSGTYVLTGTTNLSGVTSLTGTGVTFYVTSTATAPSFAINATGSLSAPTSGSYPNVLYYQVPANTTSPSFGYPGGLVNLSGVIYASGATAAQYCCTTGQVVLVFGAATFAAASPQPANEVTIPSPAPSATTWVDNVRLVQ